MLCCFAILQEKADVTLSVDSSKNDLGAVILQNGGPVGYASKTLTPAQIGKEMLAITTFGYQSFHQYLYGKSFLVETDHKLLEAIFSKPLNRYPLRLYIL